MNRRDRRRAERDRGLGRVGRLTRLAIAGAVAATGLLAAGFGHALHLPQSGLDSRSQSRPAQNDDNDDNDDNGDNGSSLQGPQQPPVVQQAPPVSVSGGS